MTGWSLTHLCIRWNYDTQGLNISWSLKDEMINRNKQRSNNSRESWARWRWLIHWAILALSPLTLLMPDCRGDPTNHHLPRSRPEEYDDRRYDSSVLANYWRNDNGPENKRQRENSRWSGWQYDVHGFAWENRQPPSWAYWPGLGNSCSTLVKKSILSKEVVAKERLGDRGAGKKIYVTTEYYCYEFSQLEKQQGWALR